MGFDLVPFFPLTNYIEMRLIVCHTQYPQSGVMSAKNVVPLNLFYGFTHIFISLPFIQVIFTNPFGHSDAGAQKPTEIRMVVSSPGNLMCK